MSKYKYDKKVLKGLSVKPFLNEVKTREVEIDKANPYDIKPIFNANVLASKLHPSHNVGYIKKIIDRGMNCKTFVIAPSSDLGFKSLPYFRAGQYISVGMMIGTSFVSRPYTLSSNPALAIGEDNNEYHITVKRKQGGFVSNYLLDKAYENMKIEFSSPLGDFSYNKIRDGKNIVALAGGSGITPFVSMASAICTGIEDFNLTIIYGNNSYDDILFKEELEELENSSNGKVKVVHVLMDDSSLSNKSSSDDAKQNNANVDVSTTTKTIGELDKTTNNFKCEKGFITADIISKYAPKDYTIYVCGPSAMYSYLESETAKLKLPKRKIRFEVPGEFGDPSKDANYNYDSNLEFNLKIVVRDDVHEIKCKASEPLISAIEKAGIKLTTDCRSGSCGWCHSRLISGDIFIPTNRDKRKIGDKKFNWIHPCITYPLSDIEMEVFPVM